MTMGELQPGMRVYWQSYLGGIRGGWRGGRCAAVVEKLHERSATIRYMDGGKLTTSRVRPHNLSPRERYAPEVDPA